MKQSKIVGSKWVPNYSGWDTEGIAEQAEIEAERIKQEKQEEESHAQ